MAIIKKKGHGRKTAKGKTRVRPHVAHVNAMPVHKPSKPSLRVEGPEAAALLRKGLNVGEPVTLTVKGYVEEAEAKSEKPSYGPQHSLKVCADRIEAPTKKRAKKGKE